MVEEEDVQAGPVRVADVSAMVGGWAALGIFAALVVGACVAGAARDAWNRLDEAGWV